MTQDAHHAPELDLASLLDLSQLPDDPSVLKQLLAQLILLVRKETKRREEVERAIDALLRNLQRSKTVPDCPGQGRLFAEEPSDEERAQATSREELDAALAGALSGGASEPSPRTARPHGRRRPAQDLETIDVVHDIADDIKTLFAEGELQPLPDVITYQYDYRPGKVMLLRHIQRKYLRRDVGGSDVPLTHDDHVGTAQPMATDPVASSDRDHEATPISETTGEATLDAQTETEIDAAEPQRAGQATRDVATTPVRARDEQRKRQLPRILLGEKRMVLSSCLAAAGLLAFVWLSKFGDHLPLYRQERITRRFGIPLARSTLCQWMMELAVVLQELYQVMIAETLRSRVLHTDDTTVQRQDPETGQWSTARFWNYVGDETYPLTVFQYTRTHERTHPATFLRDYQGYLQADAYNGYDGIYLDSGGRIMEVGCWQHARKRFKAAQSSDLRAQVAMAFIKSMYAIEKRIRKRKTREWADLSIDERAERVWQVRQAETVPLLNNFGVWLRQTSGNVLPKSELGEAIRYTLNQWDALQVFTTCGLLDADNNEAERGHRGIAIGRKNWRMVGSDRGGEAAAIHFSFIASCQMNNVEPFAYLVDILRRLPDTPREQLVDLLPHRWKPSTASPASPADQAADV